MFHYFQLLRLQFFLSLDASAFEAELMKAFKLEGNTLMVGSTPDVLDYEVK